LNKALAAALTKYDAKMLNKKEPGCEQYNIGKTKMRLFVCYFDELISLITVLYLPIAEADIEVRLSTG